MMLSVIIFDISCRNNIWRLCQTLNSPMFCLFEMAKGLSTFFCSKRDANKLMQILANHFNKINKI